MLNLGSKAPKQAKCLQKPNKTTTSLITGIGLKFDKNDS